MLTETKRRKDDMLPTSCSEMSMILVAPISDDCTWRIAPQARQKFS